MIKQSDIIGKPVIDKFGNKISYVDNIFYSKFRNRIIAFSIIKNKILKISKLIEFKDIESIGKDAILLKKNEENKSSHNEYELYSCESILEQEIFSQDGESIGFVKDILIDSKKGKVVGFIVSQGMFEDISNGRNILPIDMDIVFGQDNIIITQPLKEDYIRNKKDYKKLLELL